MISHRLMTVKNQFTLTLAMAFCLGQAVWLPAVAHNSDSSTTEVQKNAAKVAQQKKEAAQKAAAQAANVAAEQKAAQLKLPPKPLRNRANHHPSR
jgi:hypothetical protein